MGFSKLRMFFAMVRGPGSSPSHQSRMERLYRLQADTYDRSRESFLHGRKELVALLAPAEGGRLVELGGGTGRNLEFFGDRLRALERVTLIDLCPPLLEVARDRCRKRSWRNVDIVQGDATSWQPPDNLLVDTVFFSYSLTMIPDWFRAVDNALVMLKPGGRLGVVDFYISRKHPPPGHVRHGALGRAFWRWWFGRNDVLVNSDHLPYLESRTKAEFRSELRGNLPYVPFLRTPYYIFVGRKDAKAYP
jgi:S-adenosylmethionine-diacylgycerolhomoserine-N-methlytransferase